VTKPHKMLRKGRDWCLVQTWSNVETYVLRGYDTVAHAPGTSMSPTEAAKLVAKLKREGWQVAQV